MVARRRLKPALLAVAVSREPVCRPNNKAGRLMRRDVPSQAVEGEIISGRRSWRRHGIIGDGNIFGSLITRAARRRRFGRRLAEAAERYRDINAPRQNDTSLAPRRRAARRKPCRFNSGASERLIAGGVACVSWRHLASSRIGDIMSINRRQGIFDTDSDIAAMTITPLTGSSYSTLEKRATLYHLPCDRGSHQLDVRLLMSPRL